MRSLQFVSAFLAVASAVELTLHDYPSLADGSAVNNPPTCAVPYSSLNLNRITALGGLNAATDCGKCAKVCGDAGCGYFLVVDLCALEDGHLDLSTGGGPGVVGSDTGVWQVTSEFVDIKNCLGIWDGRMFFDWDDPNMYGEIGKLQALQQDSGSNYTPVQSPAAATSIPYTSSTVAPVYSAPSSVVYSAPEGTTTAVYTPPAYSTPEASSTLEVYSAPSAYSAPASSAPPAYTSETATPPVVYLTPEVYSTPEASSTPAGGFYETLASGPSTLPAYSAVSTFSTQTKSTATAATAAGHSAATGTGYYGKPGAPSGTLATWTSSSPSATYSPAQFTGAGSKSSQFSILALLAAFGVVVVVF